MYKSQLFCCGVAGLLLAAAHNVSADEAEPGDKPTGDALFQSLDADGDGQLVEEELSQDKARHYRRLLRTSDENDDGKLSRDEFASGLKPRRRQRGSEDGSEDTRRRDGRPDGNRHQPEAIFRHLDTDGDGRVVADDVPEPRRERFSRLLKMADKDGDSALTLDEFRTGMQQVARRHGRGDADKKRGQPKSNKGRGLRDEGQARGRGRAEGNETRRRPPFGPPAGGDLFESLDGDGDGQLSAAEIEGASGALAKLDSNGDGAIDRGEIFQRRPEALGQRLPKQREGRRDGQRRPSPEAILAKLKRADSDGDGKLSQQEAPERLKAHFDQVDTNGDGFVDQAEIEARLKSMHGPRGARGPRDGNDQGRRKRRPRPNRKPASRDRG